LLTHKIKMKKNLSLLVALIFISIAGYGQVPANDTCGAASPISLPSNGSACATGTTVGATATNWTTASCGQTVWNNDVWYTFVSTGTQNVAIVRPTGAPAAQKLGLSLFVGTCGTLIPAVGSCEISSTNAGVDSVTYFAPVGTVFYVEVSSFGNAGGFQLCINSTTPPPAPGNTCGTAAHLCTKDAFTVDTVPPGGSSFTPDCFGGITPGAGQWYQFTVGVSGTLNWQCTPTVPATIHSTILVPGNGIELDWAVYDISNGCPTTPNPTVGEIACNYNFEGQNSDPIGMATSANNCSNGIGPQSGTAAGELCPTYNVVAGKTYAIFINNYSYDPGTGAGLTGWNFNFTGSTFQMAPVDTFLVSPDTICGNSGTVTITNNSAAAVWQKWNFGDGNTSLAVNPGTHTYNNPGAYFISLQDSSITGCITATSKSVLISPYPTVTVPGASACPGGGSATLTATASTGGGGFVWSTGATTASITASPATTSTYTVTYTSPTGCTASATGTITVNTPTATITAVPASVCPGQSSTLTATTGTSYIWSNAATGVSTTVSPANTTTYDVTVTFSGGCTATASASVTVTSSPTATATAAPNNVCLGESSTITASAGSAYLWSNAATSGSITVSPNATTTYQVTVTIGGCTATASATVSLVSAPVAVITPASSTICPGNNDTLTASGAIGYLWSNGATTATIIVSPAANAVYSVTAADGPTCTATASANVTVAPFNISITPASASICKGASVTLNANPSTNTFVWSNQGVQTPGDVVTPTVTTTYSVTATNSNYCTATASATVVVDDLILSITPLTPTICLGQSTTLTAIGTSDPAYTWSNQIYTDTNTVSPTVSTKYVVVATDTFGCHAADSVVVVLVPAPVVSFTVTTPVCVGQAGTITFTGTASPAAVYTWGFNGGTVLSGTGKGPYQVSWASAGTEQVSLNMTDNGCSGNPDTMTVLVNTIPVVTAGTDTEFCSGNTAIIGGASTAGYTYSWTPANGLSDATVSNPTVILTNTSAVILQQTYTVTASNNGCTSSDSVVIKVDPIPVAQFTNPAPQCLLGNHFQFIAGGSFLPSATFAWTFGTNAVPLTSTSQSQSVTYSAAQTTAVTLTISQLGCLSNTYTDSVTVNPMPVSSFHADTLTGCPGLNVCFTNNSTVVGAATYLWNFGDGQISGVQAPCHVYATPGSFTVSLKVTANNCSNDSTSPNLIKINTPPVARFTPSATVIQQPQSEIDFTNQSSNASTYLWNFANLGNSTDVNPVFHFTQYGQYDVVLYAYNAAGCTDSTELPISVLPPQNFFIPNVFSPNGDGKNDLFYIEMQEGVTVIEFTVFDRWGEKVHDGQFPWDGTYKGKPCPQDVYVYIFKLQLASSAEGIKRTGSITLLR